MLAAFKDYKKVKQTLGSILPMPEFGRLQVSEKPPVAVSGKPKLVLKSPADFTMSKQKTVSCASVPYSI